MDEKELLRVENLFIRLYNQDLSFDEIVSSLKVDANLVAKWQENLEKALEASRYHGSNLDVVAVAKNEDGSYEFKHSLQFQVSGKERVRMSLWMISSKKLEPENSTLFKFNYLIEEARRHLVVVEKYLDDVTFKDKDADNYYRYTIHTKVNDPEIFKELERAINFFISVVLGPEDSAYEYMLIKENSIDVFSNSTKSLPYGIKQIKIENYLDIKSTHIESIPIDAKWIFITGENGYGKTSFLQAIAIGLIGYEDEGTSLIDDDSTKIGIEYKDNNANRINNVHGQEFKSLDNLLCYGPARLQIQSGMSKNDENKQSSTTYNLFNTDGVLLNIENLLVIWYLDDKERFDQAKSIFKKIIPTLSDILVQKNKLGEFEILYIEHNEKNPSEIYKPVPFNKMAAGLKSIMAMVGDMLVRFTRKQPDLKDFSMLSGIILIDELENHLHPKWQIQLPTRLSNTFPEVQFIATTHSVIPILGAPEGSVFLKLSRSTQDGVTVERLDIDVANLLPNAILTSPIFDMNSIMPLSNQDFSQIRTEETFEEIIDNDKVDERLKAFELANQNYPDSLFE